MPAILVAKSEMLRVMALAIALATAGDVAGAGGSQLIGIQPTWTSLGPGGGGWVMTLAASPHGVDKVFLGGDTEGVFSSENGGQSWTVRNEGLRDYWIETILYDPTDPNVIYVGGRSGVYKSTDQGQSWQWRRTGFPAVSGSSYSAPVSALAMDPVNPSVIYAGIGSPRDGLGKQGTVYRSVDAGDTWSRVNTGGGLPADAVISSLFFHPTSQTPAPGTSTSRTLYLSSQYGFFVSTDGGVSWTASNAGLPHTNVARVAVSRSRPEVMYLTLHTPLTAPWRGGVYKSENGGKTWTARNNGLRQLLGADATLTSNYQELAIDSDNPNVVYLGSADYRTPPMYKTNDGGLNWAPIINLPTTSTVGVEWGTGRLSLTVQALSMSPLNPRVLYHGTGMTVSRTTDGGQTWQQAYTRLNSDGSTQTTGLEMTYTHFIMVDPRNSQRVFYGYQDIGLFVSEDGGVTVRRKAGDLPYPTPANTAYAVAIDPNDPQRLWGSFGPWENRPPGFVIAESTDLGRTWVMRKDGLPEGPYKRLLLDDSGPTRRLLASVKNNGIYASDDGGKRWSPSSTGLAHGDVRDLVAHPSLPGSYFCVLAGKDTSPGILYRSDDRGATWQRLSGPTLEAWDITQLAVSRILYVAARRIFIGSRVYGGGIYSSEDGGLTWKLVLDDPFAQAVNVDPINAQVVYAGLTDHPYHDDSRGNGLKMSQDGGATWTDITVLPQSRVTVLTLHPDNSRRLFVGTAGNGVGIVDFNTSIGTSTGRRP